MAENLRLSYLGKATGINGSTEMATSLSACNGGTDSNIKMNDFTGNYSGANLNPTSYTWDVGLTSVTFYYQFTSEGSRYSRIKTNSSNFNWQIVEGYVQFDSTNAYYANVSPIDYLYGEDYVVCQFTDIYNGISYQSQDAICYLEFR